MRLADFIVSNVEPILCEWEVFARSIGAAENLDSLALRDHADAILQATARDMQSDQTGAQRDQKSRGEKPRGEDVDVLDGVSDRHAIDRLGLGFDMLEVMSEYRALRASVLRLWRESGPGVHEFDLDDLTRFNESIDQSLTNAAASYTTRVNQARDMFLAILSHDLRNPLNSIGMTAQMVPLIVHDAAGALECSEQLERSVNVMNRMIGDLLDYTRTRLGAGMPVDPEPMDLAVVGRDLMQEFKAANPGREISYRISGDLNGRWDADRLRQVISNLMGNALQHGAEDQPVVLTIRGEGQSIGISVHNGGPPISPGEMPKIFNPLVRGSSAQHPTKNRTGSIGMGLYIAREVAKSHNGQIWVTSTAVDGTTFTISLPRESAPKVGQPILDAEHIKDM